MKKLLARTLTVIGVVCVVFVFYFMLFWLACETSGFLHIYLGL